MTALCLHEPNNAPSSTSFALKTFHHLGLACCCSHSEGSISRLARPVQLPCRRSVSCDWSGCLASWTPHERRRAPASGTCSTSLQARRVSHSDRQFDLMPAWARAPSPPGSVMLAGATTAPPPRQLEVGQTPSVWAPAPGRAHRRTHAASPTTGSSTSATPPGSVSEEQSPGHGHSPSCWVPQRAVAASGR